MRSSFGRPCRCAREAGAHAAGACCRRTRTRPHARAMSAPVPARLRRLRARLSATPLALAIGTCERAASPVLLTACALLPRYRQPQLREVGLDGHRALDVSVTTGRRDVDTTVTRIRPPARPRSGPGGAKPVPVPVSRARSSSRLRPRRRTARPAHHRVRPRRLRPAHRRHANQGVATPAPPLGSGPPHHHITASRTTPAHTHPCSTHLHLHRTHSRHRLSRRASFHSTARASTDTFLVPARSPRKTRPSRRPRRSARPLVRPTSFMRTTTPRPPPAKALRMMSRLRCAQSLHECEPGTRGLQCPPSTAPLLPRGRV